MRKDPKDYTAGEAKYEKLFRLVQKGNYIASQRIKNAATTLAGDFVMGLTYHVDRQYYSASAIEIDGVRDNGKLCSWDQDGIALDADLSDLVLGSVHEGVNRI